MPQPALVTGARTPIGKLLGALSGLSAPELAGTAITAACSRRDHRRAGGLVIICSHDVRRRTVSSEPAGSPRQGLPTRRELLRRCCAGGAAQVTVTRPRPPSSVAGVLGS